METWLPRPEMTLLCTNALNAESTLDWQALVRSRRQVCSGFISSFYRYIYEEHTWRETERQMEAGDINSVPLIKLWEAEVKKRLQSSSPLPLLIYTAAFLISHNTESCKHSLRGLPVCLPRPVLLTASKWQKALELHLTTASHKSPWPSIDLVQICSYGWETSVISNAYRAERNHRYIYTLDQVRKTPRKFWGHIYSRSCLSCSVFQLRAWTTYFSFMADVGRLLSFARFPRAVWRFEPVTFKEACRQTSRSFF